MLSFAGISNIFKLDAVFGVDEETAVGSQVLCYDPLKIVHALDSDIGNPYSLKTRDANT